MIKKATIFQGEKIRYVIAWVLIVLSIIAIVTFCVYNKSAFMILFGKTRINLNEYEKTVSYVYDNTTDFKNISSEGTEEYGSLTYQTTDDIGFFTVNGADNEIYFIDAHIDMGKFLALSLTDKYRSIDKILQPICNKSDILATEIGILKISSQSALNKINFLNFDFDTSQNIELSSSSSNSYVINAAYQDSMLNLRLSIRS